MTPQKTKLYLRALSRARELLTLLDKSLGLTGDPETFLWVNEKEVMALQVPLLNARRATANILASLGDDQGYRNPPPEQILRSPIRVSEPHTQVGQIVLPGTEPEDLLPQVDHTRL